MVRLLAAALVLFALGCGGGAGPGKAAGRAPVTEADVQALIGRPAGDVVKLLGAPDLREELGLMTWRDVPTPSGRRSVSVHYDRGTGAVTLVNFNERLTPLAPGVDPVPRK